ncbi:hypothetical protein A7P61_11495 [Pantoea agglomerans pv. betae]|nr:hypothetical protein [Pantoea agglomerans]WHU85563.1 hypothetical protein A7P61_11495 [Pantoea agglomerans pv. betae]
MLFSGLFCLSLPSFLSDLLLNSRWDVTMKLSILLTLLAATVCSVFAAHGKFETQQAGQSLFTQSGETISEE